MVLSRQSKIQFSFSRIIYLYIALLLLIIPIRLVFAAAISAAVHELFHVAAIRLMKLPIYSIHIGIHGARIETQPMTDKQELLCAISGPLGGLLLLLLFRWMPVVALTGAVQSLYNLLPLYPTDGGRTLHCCAKLLLPDKFACRIVYIAEIITLSVILACGVYGSVWLRLGIIPVVFAVTLLLRSVKRK